MFLSSPSLRFFSSQECSFPQESYLLFLFLSPTLFPSISLSLSNVSVTFSTSRSFLFPTSSPRFCSLYQVAFVPPASPFLAHLFHLLYTFTGLLLSLANSLSPPFAFLFSLLDEGRTKITNPRGICREPQLDRGVSPGRALAPAVTFQP